MTSQAVEAISDVEYRKISSFLYRHCGIDMSPAKKVLIASRLRRRATHYGLASVGEYFDYATASGNDDEKTTMVDLLTTNETYFFREPEHFLFLNNWLANHRSQLSSINAWSAACSSGEEAYSIAMLLADNCPELRWQVIGSDLSTKVLEKAETGHYQLARNENLSLEFKKKYCLKGYGPYEGSFIVQPELQQRVSFHQWNLLSLPAETPVFDIIFLRNVMIYFDRDSKQQVINNILKKLKPGGLLFISHTESLFEIRHPLKPVRPSVFAKPD